MKKFFMGMGLLTFIWVILSGCGGQTEPAAAPEEAAVELPAAAAVPSPSPAPAATRFDKYALPVGQTAEGAFFIGREDAPVTMIDYSNFL